jgi:hypothetical protein
MPNRTTTQVLGVLSANMPAIRALGVTKLALFGSGARNEATTASDLDFLVEFRKKSFDAYVDLKALLERLFETRVDLVLLDGVKPRLRDRILAEAVYAA